MRKLLDSIIILAIFTATLYFMVWLEQEILESYLTLPDGLVSKRFEDILARGASLAISLFVITSPAIMAGAIILSLYRIAKLGIDHNAGHINQKSTWLSRWS